MSRYYLIDYENVNSKNDIKGWNAFAEDVVIYLFYTPNVTNISLDIINNHGQAKLEFVPVVQGSQSLDMHLVSFLGYLIGQDKDSSYVIVSKDTDYDKIIKFWKEKASADISRVDKISSKTKKNTSTEGESVSKKSGNANKGTKPKATNLAQLKMSMNGDIQKAVSKIYDQSVANEVASITVKLLGSDNMPMKIHTELTKKYTNGVEVYASIKSIVAKYSKAVKELAVGGETKSEKQVEEKVSGKAKNEKQVEEKVTVKTKDKKQTNTKKQTKVETTENKAEDKKLEDGKSEDSKTKVKKSEVEKTEVKKPEVKKNDNKKNDIVAALTDLGKSKADIKHITDIIKTHREEKNGKQIIYRSIISKFGQEEGLATYNAIKKLL